MFFCFRKKRKEAASRSCGHLRDRQPDRSKGQKHKTGSAKTFRSTLYICVVAVHDCVLIIDPVNSLLTLLLRCVSEARPARGYRADLTAVDRRQRHHSLHAWCSRAQTQEEIPEVGPEDPTQLSALGFYFHPHQKSVFELRVSAVVGLCNATLWLRGVCFHLHRPPARVLHV